MTDTDIADELRALARGIESGDAEVRNAKTRPVLTLGADAVALEVEWHA